MRLLQTHKRRPNHTSARPGFTLVELLVVIAITSILLGLLFGPIIQAFNITRRTQAIAAAQDAARFGLERMTREISQAAFVFDNTRTPIILPIGNKDYLGNNPPSPFRYAPFVFAKLDLIPAATRTPGDNDFVDPTSNRLLSGDQLQFPLARGTRVVRYFIGLNRNTTGPDGQTAATYSNDYLFPEDNGFNPFVLYRAEFDPSDPNLVKRNITPQDPNYYTPDSGSFDDPNFFYNTNNTEGTGSNGNTYAKNWGAIATRVVAVDRADLIAWNLGRDRRPNTARPFRTTASFQPATVIGDTATPGYLTDLGNATPNAVPSLYTAKYGQWVLPFTLTFYRGATRGRVTDNYVKVTFTRDGVTARGDGTLGTGGNAPEFIARQSLRGQNQGRWFIQTENVSFFVDPQRGRVVTGLPTFATDNNGAPLFDANNDPIPTVFRLNTRGVEAGGVIYSTFQGITQAELRDNPDTDEVEHYYYPVQGDAPVVGSLPPPGDGRLDIYDRYRSPFDLNPTLASFNGALLVPGSERVLGPDNNPFRNPDIGSNLPGTDVEIELVPYFRVPATAVVLKSRKQDLANGGKFLGLATGPLNYKLEQDVDPLRPAIIFDESKNTAGGLTVNDDAYSSSNTNEREVQVSFLWQNNYRRAPADGTSPDVRRGDPLDINGNPVAATSAAPEADVVKVDYSTRALLNLSLGVRVYDPSSRRSELVQLSDRVKINNVQR